jgi:hypothetical protein
MLEDAGGKKDKGKASWLQSVWWDPAKASRFEGRDGGGKTVASSIPLTPSLAASNGQGNVGENRTRPKVLAQARTVFTPEEDEILRSGYRNGWYGKRQAVKEILTRHPESSSQAIRRRARKLVAANDPQKPKGEGRKPWSKRELDLLLDLAGCRPVEDLAELVGRSVRSVACRLNRLGISCQMKEGQSLRELCRELHMGPNRVRRIINSGVLRVANGRIRVSSLLRFCGTKAGELGIDVSRLQGQLEKYEQGYGPRRLGEILAVPATEVAKWIDEGLIQARDLTVPVPSLRAFCENHPEEINIKPLIRELTKYNYSADRVAKVLGVPLASVRSWLTKRWLKMADQRISEGSIQEFYKNQSAEINFHLLDASLRQWLTEEMGASEGNGLQEIGKLRAFQSHAKTARITACGRRILGNAWSRHVRRCSECQRAGSRRTDFRSTA